MKAQLVGIGVAALALLAPTLAGAQTAERTYLEHGVPAPAQALELTVGTGWTQGFGNLSSGVGMPSVAHEGIGVDASAGYRIDPHFALSIGGQYQELNAQASSAARGATATIAGQYHMAPYTRLDPWLELGSGYRGLWLVPSVANTPTNLVHGWQIARARLGFDVRLSPDIAIAPVIGADATMFLFQDIGGNNSAIGSPAVSTFVFAGLQGRIDLGGNKVGTAVVTSASPDYD
ncbi:MAG: hypothetical protein JWO86_8045 [Myxococcaceae bacterium]|jgi:hypothetical protein|nr:hypothetical protein [Myxococcaceae bacterium]MEA2749697.1 hypothetical protein [Myxococcales bacterium]